MNQWQFTLIETPDFFAGTMTRRFFFGLCLFAGLGCVAPLPATAQSCANPKALGTSRVMTVDTSGGLALGFKTYPQSLALADHELVLTFDDGPWPVTTPQVLDALAKDCVRATFFLIGRNAAANPALVRREVAEGHTVGHHTFSHPAATLRGFGAAKAEADIEQGFAADDRAAYGTVGSEPRVPFFRFPGFADTLPLLRWLDARNIAVFGTDIWASDWDPMTPGEELDKLLYRIDKAGRGIVLLHDVKEQTAAMLPQFLRELKQRGYSIVHIEPGGGPTATRLAGTAWTSETERSLARMGYVERPADMPAELPRLPKGRFWRGPP